MDANPHLFHTWYCQLLDAICSPDKTAYDELPGLFLVIGTTALVRSMLDLRKVPKVMDASEKATQNAQLPSIMGRRKLG